MPRTKEDLLEWFPNYKPIWTAVGVENMDLSEILVEIHAGGIRSVLGGQNLCGRGERPRLRRISNIVAAQRIALRADLAPWLSYVAGNIPYGDAYLCTYWSTECSVLPYLEP